MNGSEQSKAQPKSMNLLRSLVRINANKGSAVLHLSCGTDLARVFVQAGEVVHLDGVSGLFGSDLESPTGRLDHDIGALIGSGVPANEAMNRAAKSIGKFLVEVGTREDCNWGIRGGENSPDSVISLPVGLASILVSAYVNSSVSQGYSENFENSLDRMVKVCKDAIAPSGLPPLSSRVYKWVNSKDRSLQEVLGKVSKGTGGRDEANRAVALLFAFGLIEFTVETVAPNVDREADNNEKTDVDSDAVDSNGWTVESLEAAERKFTQQHPFQIFGLVCDESSNKITPYDVRSAFRKVAADFHPDRFADATEDVQVAAEKVFAYLNHSRSKIESQEDLDRTIRRFMPKKSKEGVVTEIDRSKAKGYMRTAEARMRHGKWSDAREFILQAIEQVPEDKGFQVLEIFCRGVMKTLSYAKAAALIEEVETDTTRQHAEKYYRAGWLYKLGGDQKSAKDRFNKALVHDPNHVDCSRELRMLGSRTKNEAKAKRKDETKIPFARFFKKK